MKITRVEIRIEGTEDEMSDHRALSAFVRERFPPNLRANASLLPVRFKRTEVGMEYRWRDEQ